MILFVIGLGIGIILWVLLIASIYIKSLEAYTNTMNVYRKLEKMQIEIEMMLDKINAEVTCIANHYLLKDKEPK